MNILVLDDRPIGRREFFNRGDEMMVVALHRLLTEISGARCSSSPWKPFPYFRMGAYKENLRRRSSEEILNDWVQEVTARAQPGLAQAVESKASRVLKRAEAFRPLAAMEKRWQRRHGVGLFERMRVTLLRKALAAEVVTRLRDADVALWLGGGILADHLLTYLPSFLFELYLAQRLGCRTIVASYSFTVTDPLAREVAAVVLPAVDVHLVREPLSEQRLIELGVPPERIHVLPDFAWAWEVPANSSQDALGQWRNRLRNGVGLAIRGDRAVHVDGWVQVARNLRAAGRPVALIQTCPSQDAPVARKIAAESGAQLLPTTLPLAALISSFGWFDLVVTDRFHGAIMALVAGVPVVPLEANTIKLRGMFQMAATPYRVRPPMSASTKDEILGAMLETLAQQELWAAESRVIADTMRRQLRNGFFSVFTSLQEAQSS